MKNQILLLLLFFGLNIYGQTKLTKDIPAPYKELVKKTLSSAGDNSEELVRFLEAIPENMLEGAAFLVAYMPVEDSRTLNADFLLRNTQLAYGTRAKYPWGKAIPDSIFFNDVLPYMVVDEQRENWRLFMTFRIEPLVKDAESLSEAVYEVGQGAKTALNVKYSTRRPKTNQAPSETIMAGIATCSGLSITMVAALRSVGIPARMAGTLRWYGSKKGGNHNWVEAWIDGKWYCCELAPFVGFDRGWFLKKIKPEIREYLGNHIFASSYKHTGQRYPLVWDRFFHTDSAWQAGFTNADDQITAHESVSERKKTCVHFLDNTMVFPLDQPVINVPGVDVTERYISMVEKKYFKQRQENAGKMLLSCVVLEKEVTSKERENRIPCDIKIFDAKGNEVGVGKTFTNEHDINDHLTFYLPKGEYTIQYNGKKKVVSLDTSEHFQLVY